MNADRLLAHYSTIAEAPDAVSRFRRYILDLAMRGKLVSQDINDEPAAHLLERIAKSKSEIPANGRRGRRPSAQKQGYEADFRTPPGWTMSDMGDVTLKITDGAHKTPTYVESGVPFVSVKDFSGGRLDLSKARRIPLHEHAKLYERCDPRRGDILIGRIGTLGKAVLVDVDVEFSLFVSVGLIRVDHTTLDPRFFVLMLNSPFMARQFDRIKIGGATHTNKLNLSDLYTVCLLLPPLAEQRRIVAKVNALIELCDRIEAARIESGKARGRLTTASFARLSAPKTESSLRDARFVFDSFRETTANPSQIGVLRRTILNLAVTGKLVRQDPNDEPAATLFEKDSPVEALTPIARLASNGLPNLPVDWLWIRMGSLVENSDAGWSPKTENFPRAGDKWGVLKVSAVSWGKFRPWENKQILHGSEPRLQAKVNEGDFLISRANTIDLIARAVIVEERPQNLMMSDKIVRLKFSDQCDKRYILLVNNYADFAREYYRRHASGVSPSMKNVTREAILGLPCPLAPLAEQSRIVAKVERLMALCDQLEKNLIFADETRNRLLDSLLAEALQDSADAIAA